MDSHKLDLLKVHMSFIREWLGTCELRTVCPHAMYTRLKHTTTLFALSDHYILIAGNGDLLLIKYKPIIMVGL